MSSPASTRARAARTRVNAYPFGRVMHDQAAEPMQPGHGRLRSSSAWGNFATWRNVMMLAKRVRSE